jgi:hypothetical protein
VTQETPIPADANTIAPTDDAASTSSTAATETAAVEPGTATATAETESTAATTAEPGAETGSEETTGECRRYIPAVGVTITVGC